MLRFLGLKRRPKVKPAALAYTPAMVLVTTQDIYQHRSPAEAPLLLLKKGATVQPDDLPRLLRQGARPNQFAYQTPAMQSPEKNLPEFIHKAAPSGASAVSHSPVPASSGGVHGGIDNPIITPDRDSRYQRAKHAFAQKHALILEPDQKSLKRLIDCLFICGFPLDHIHGLRMSQALNWSFEKYQPDLLIINYQLAGTDGLTVLQGLLPRLRNVQCILTIPGEQQLKIGEKTNIESFCTEHAIQILPKPVNRFIISRLLIQPEPLAH